MVACPPWSCLPDVSVSRPTSPPRGVPGGVSQSLKSVFIPTFAHTAPPHPRLSSPPPLLTHHPHISKHLPLMGPSPHNPHCGLFCAHPDLPCIGKSKSPAPQPAWPAASLSPPLEGPTAAATSHWHLCTLHPASAWLASHTTTEHGCCSPPGLAEELRPNRLPWPGYQAAVSRSPAPCSAEPGSLLSHKPGLVLPLSHGRDTDQPSGGCRPRATISHFL